MARQTRLKQILVLFVTESRIWAGVSFTFVLLPGRRHKGKKESSTRLPLIGDLEIACQNWAKRCPGAQGWHDVGRAASETGRGGL